MKAHRHDRRHLFLDQINARNAARPCYASRIDAHGFGSRITTLRGRAFAAPGLGTAKIGNPRHAAIVGDDCGNGQHAQWDGADERRAIRVEYSQGVVRGQRQHRETL